MKKIKKALRLYGHYISINVRSMMQYKSSFVLTTIGHFLMSFNVFLGIYFMFRRFHTVRGFTYPEVLLCFSIVILEFAIAEMYARGFDSFSGLVRRGGFDRVLLRPRNEILQVLGDKFELTRVGRMLQAVVMFVYGVMMSGVSWNIFKIMAVFFMVVGGVAVFTGLFILYAAICFFTLEGLEVFNILTDGAREFGKYPIGIYGKKVLMITTFVIPYALVQYYPLLYILDKSACMFYVFLPLLALLFLVPCCLFWRCGVRHYKSSGS